MKQICLLLVGIVLATVALASSTGLCQNLPPSFNDGLVQFLWQLGK